MDELFNNIKKRLEQAIPTEISFGKPESSGPIKEIIDIEFGTNQTFSLLHWSRFGIPSIEKISLVKNFLPDYFLKKPIDLEKGLEQIRYIEKETILEIYKPNMAFSRKEIRFGNNNQAYNFEDVAKILSIIF